MLGRLGSCNAGSEGRLTEGNSNPVKSGSGRLTWNEMLGRLGSDSVGKPGRLMLGNPQLNCHYSHMQS
jgi:hypothetical protein